MSYQLTPGSNYTQNSQVNPNVVYPNHYLNRIPSTQFTPEISQVKRPIYQNFEHQPSPIKVVARNDVESTWRNQQSMLERQIRDLQTELAKYRNTPQNIEKTTYIEDTNRVNQLHQEVDRLNRTLIDLNNEIEIWRQKYNSLEQKIIAQRNLEVEVEKMKKLFQDNEIMLNSQLYKLQDDLDDKVQALQQRDLEIQQLRQSQRNNLETDQFISINPQNNYKKVNLQTELKKAQITIQSKIEDNKELNERLRKFQQIEQEYDKLQQEFERAFRQFQEKDQESKILQAKLRDQSQRDRQFSNVSDEMLKINILLQEKEKELFLAKKNQARLEEQILNLNNENLDLIETVKTLNIGIDKQRQSDNPLKQSQDDRENNLWRVFSQINNITKEIDQWKQKFLNINVAYSKLQEDYLQLQREQSVRSSQVRR